ncbi:MAG: RsbRD N-terminal domain-containing protein [Desulfurivibrionaceae bacterium]|nr:RsbRD N-terminal domain-containing protein [Desulfobulbales bacterium]MDT8334433.1 RsbRD N-terminal domain-containing protein [Desulfurivibrionaceae bacterium]
MKILQLLIEKEEVIVKRWLKQVLAAFSADANRFLANQSDRFANPLGHNFSTGLTGLYRNLRSEEPGDITEILEQLMKVRAVQAEDTPAESLAFIFALKIIIREECRKEWSPELDAEWPELAARVDRLALHAFDLYMACRERLYQVRIREMQRGNHHLTDNMKCPSAMVREDMQGKQAEND